MRVCVKLARLVVVDNSLFAVKNLALLQIVCWTLSNRILGFAQKTRYFLLRASGQVK